MSRVIKRGALTEALPRWLPEARAEEPKSPFDRAQGRLRGEGSAAEDRDTGAEEMEGRRAALEREARERGLARGMSEAEEAYRAKGAKLDALAASLHDERAGFFDRIEPELVRLSVSIAEKVIGQELELRPGIVVDMVRSAVKRLRDRESLRVSVNPSDVERVKEAREDLIGAIDGVRKMDIIEDRRVGAGGCVIESPSGTLDARIRTQIDEIGRVLGDISPTAKAMGEVPPAAGAVGQVANPSTPLRAGLPHGMEAGEHGDSGSHPVPESG